MARQVVSVSNQAIRLVVQTWWSGRTASGSSRLARVTSRKSGSAGSRKTSCVPQVGQNRRSAPWRGPIAAGVPSSRRSLARHGQPRHHGCSGRALAHPAVAVAGIVRLGADPIAHGAAQAAAFEGKLHGRPAIIAYLTQPVVADLDLRPRASRSRRRTHPGARRRCPRGIPRRSSRRCGPVRRAPPGSHLPLHSERGDARSGIPIATDTHFTACASGETPDPKVPDRLVDGDDHGLPVYSVIGDQDMSRPSRGPTKNQSAWIRLSLRYLAMTSPVRSRVVPRPR